MIYRKYIFKKRHNVLLSLVLFISICFYIPTVLLASTEVCYTGCFDGICFAPDHDLVISTSCCLPPFSFDESPTNNYIHTFKSVEVRSTGELTACSRSDAQKCVSEDNCIEVEEARGNLHIRTVDTVTGFRNDGTINLSGMGEGRVPMWLGESSDIASFLSHDSLEGSSISETAVTENFKIVTIPFQNVDASIPSLLTFTFVKSSFSSAEEFLVIHPNNADHTLKFIVNNSSTYDTIFNDSNRDITVAENVSLSVGAIREVLVQSSNSFVAEGGSALRFGSRGLTGAGCSDVRSSASGFFSSCNNINGINGGEPGASGGLLYVESYKFVNNGTLNLSGTTGEPSGEGISTQVDGSNSIVGAVYESIYYNYINVMLKGTSGSGGGSGFVFVKASIIEDTSNSSVLFECTANDCGSSSPAVVSSTAFQWNPDLDFSGTILNLDNLLSLRQTSNYLFRISEVGYKSENNIFDDYRYFPITSLSYSFQSSSKTLSAYYFCLNDTASSCSSLNNTLINGTTYNTEERQLNWFLSSKTLSQSIYAHDFAPPFYFSDFEEVSLDFSYSDHSSLSPSLFSSFTLTLDQFAPCDKASDICKLSIFDANGTEKNLSDFAEETERIATLNDLDFSFQFSINDYSNDFSSISSIAINSTSSNIKVMPVKLTKESKLYTVSTANNVVEFSSLFAVGTDMACDDLFASGGAWEHKISSFDFSYNPSREYKTKDASSVAFSLRNTIGTLLEHQCDLSGNRLCDGEIWLFMCITDSVSNWSRIISVSHNGTNYSSSLLSGLDIDTSHYDLEVGINSISNFYYPLSLVYDGITILSTLGLDDFKVDNQLEDEDIEGNHLKFYQRLVFDFAHDIDSEACNSEPCNLELVTENSPIVFSKSFFGNNSEVIGGIHLPNDVSGVKNVWFITSSTSPLELSGARILNHHPMHCLLDIPDDYRDNVNFCFNLGTGNFDEQKLYLWLEDHAGNINTIYNSSISIPVDTLPPFKPILDCFSNDITCLDQSVSIFFANLNTGGGGVSEDSLDLYSTDSTSSILGYKLCFWQYDPVSDQNNSDNLSDNLSTDVLQFIQTTGDCPTVSFFKDVDNISLTREWCVFDKANESLPLSTFNPISCQNASDIYCENSINGRGNTICSFESGVWGYTVYAIDIANNYSSPSIGTELLTLGVDTINLESVIEHPYIDGISSTNIHWVNSRQYNFLPDSYNFKIRYELLRASDCETNSLPRVWVDVDGDCPKDPNIFSLHDCISEEEKFSMVHISAQPGCQVEVGQSFSSLSQDGNFISQNINLDYISSKQGQVVYAFVARGTLLQPLYEIDILPYDLDTVSDTLQVRNNVYRLNQHLPVILVNLDNSEDRITLSIFDDRGRLIRMIYKNFIYGEISPYTEWDTKSDKKTAVPSGHYYVVLQVEDINNKKRNKYQRSIVIIR